MGLYPQPSAPESLFPGGLRGGGGGLAVVVCTLPCGGGVAGGSSVRRGRKNPVASPGLVGPFEEEPRIRREGLRYMVWYGMVWYGMVWYGMVWYGMVWYGMVWYGMVWYGMLCRGVVCQRRCYQKAMAGMVLHTGKCKPAGLCVEVCVVCSVLCACGRGPSPSLTLGGCRPGLP